MPPKKSAQAASAAADGTPPADAADQLPGDQQAQTPPPEPAGDSNAGEGKAQEPPAGQGFSQADLDRIAGKARKEGREALLRDLGIQDVESVKAALAESEKIKREQMTEAERLKADKEKAEAEAARAKADAEQVRAESNRALVRAAVISKAAGRFANPQAVTKLLDMEQLKLNADGEVDGLDDALNALAEKEPWTLAPQGKQVPDIGATNSGGKGSRQGRSDAERKQTYFGGGARSDFWDGGGNIGPE